MDAKTYLRLPYQRVLIPNDDGTYTAFIREFQGCVAEGDTPNQAIDHLEAAAESWIDVSLHLGQPIPEPLWGNVPPLNSNSGGSNDWPRQ